MTGSHFAGALIAAAVVGVLATPAAAKVIHVDIRKLVFEPASVAVNVGDTVEWTNHDILAHTATGKDKSWEVNLPPGATGRYEVEAAGAIDYFCRFHPNMRGVIEAAAP